jgi:hypothetical protein
MTDIDDIPDVPAARLLAVVYPLLVLGSAIGWWLA